jgi:predicted nicotinamide N-methyase
MKPSFVFEAPQLDVPGGWTRRTLELVGKTFAVVVPADPDRVLDAHVAVHQESDPRAAAAVPDPYWAALWSAATPTAELVLKTPWSGRETVIEIGCGLGLVGLAALACRLDVTFSDHVPVAIQAALANARHNGYANARAMLLDWNDPPNQQYSLVLASDILYSRASHAAILATIDRIMAPQGVCWIGDPGRLSAGDFVKSAADRFCVALHDRDGNRFSVPAIGHFQLLVLRRR